VCFQFEGELGDHLLEARVLLLQSLLALALLLHLKGFGGIRQKLITPLVLLSLTDLVVLANGRHGFALQPLQDRCGLRLGVPLASLHG